MAQSIKTPVGDAPLIPLVVLGIGGYLAWFGIHYWRSDVKYPTTPLKSVLQGNGITATTAPASHLSQLQSDVSGASAQEVNTNTSSTNQPPSTTTGITASQFTQVATFDHASLMALWEANGGAASQANNAACHAIQESSGNPKVTSPNPDGGTNVGLWQLDTKGVGAGYTVVQLQDPDTNARLTVMHTANGTNWSQWATSGC